MLLMFILVTKLNMYDKICKLIIQIIIIILNYILSKLLVFKNSFLGTGFNLIYISYNLNILQILPILNKELIV